MINQDTHLHSNFSDGKNSIEEMAKAAIKLGLKEIAFTEHVRRSTEWLDEFVKEVKGVQKKYPQIKIYSGIESKAIDLEGNIDAKEKFFNKVDLVLGALHRIPEGREKYLLPEQIISDKKGALGFWLRAMAGLLRNKNVDIVAHPGAILKKYGIKLPLSAKKDFVEGAKRHKKTVEINSKYKVPDRETLRMLKGRRVKITYGSDSHSVKDLRRFARLKFI